MSKIKLNKLNISSLKKVNSTISLSNIKTETFKKILWEKNQNMMIKFRQNIQTQQLHSNYQKVIKFNLFLLLRSSLD